MMAGNVDDSKDPYIKRNEEYSDKDFYFGKLIGEGSFSSVYLAKDIHTERQYAIKICEKSHIKRENKIESIMREKRAMIRLKDYPSKTAPFFVKLARTFQCDRKLYFVMTYCKNGELRDWIKRVSKFSKKCASFYGAEILRALEHLHSLKIIHRDLKPENILLDENMHIKITDFGSVKILSDDETTDLGRRGSLAGTAQYVSPEALKSEEMTYSADLWAFGCILYQMVSGTFAFNDGSEYLIFIKIQNLNYSFPDGFDQDAKDLVKKLLVIESKNRLGANDENGYPSIRSHSFFCHLDFDTLYMQEPPVISNTHLPDEDVRWGSLPQVEFLQINSFTPKEKRKAPSKEKDRIQYYLNLSDEELRAKVIEQETSNPYHKYVEGNLILKQGILYKRKKSLYPQRRRLFLLTTGPALYYIDLTEEVIKGCVPWSENLLLDLKNFKNFYIHTPNRTYDLEDPDGTSHEWRDALEIVRNHYFPKEV